MLLFHVISIKCRIPKADNATDESYTFFQGLVAMETGVWAGCLFICLEEEVIVGCAAIVHKGYTSSECSEREWNRGEWNRVWL